MNIDKTILEVNTILSKYNISQEDRMLFWNIIYPIFTHEEFQKRMNPKLYPHHDKISLGNHIISDAILTFVLAKKAQNIDINLAVTIAMFHDLYELPWQNANIKKSMYINKHGFIHPLEGIINAITWYPTYFKSSEQAETIIDGVVHHMWPFPVRAIDSNIEDIELNNTDKWYQLDSSIKNLIISSSMIGYIKNMHISLHRSRNKEGRLMSRADTIISFSKDISFNGVLACFTGKNN